MRSDMRHSPRHQAAASNVWRAVTGGDGGGAERSTLLPQSKSLDDALVALKIARAQIVEHAPALAHELEQASTGMMVAFVRLEVIGQIADPIAQERNLDLR